MSFRLPSEFGKSAYYIFIEARINTKALKKLLVIFAGRRTEFQGSSHHGRLHYLSLSYPGWYISVSKDLISIYDSNRVDQTMLSSKCHIAKSLSNFCCHGAWGRRSYFHQTKTWPINSLSYFLTTTVICQYLLKYCISTLALLSQWSWVA